VAVARLAVLAEAAVAVLVPRRELQQQGESTLAAAAVVQETQLPLLVRPAAKV
jgi:hypothetical protein